MKKEPRWGWHREGLQATSEQPFTEEDVSKILEHIGIIDGDPRKIEFAQMLQDRARLYQIFKRDADGAPRTAWKRVALAELIESPDPVAALTKLDDETLKVLAAVADQDARQPDEPPPGVVQSLGRIRLRKSDRDPEALREWARRALANLPVDRGGRPPKNAAIWFAEYLAVLYYRERDELPKRSYYSIKKQDGGRFYEFAYAALERLDPEEAAMSSLGHPLRMAIERFEPPE